MYTRYFRVVWISLLLPWLFFLTASSKWGRDHGIPTSLLSHPTSVRRAVQAKGPLRTKEFPASSNIGAATPSQTSLIMNGSFELADINPGNSYIQLNGGDTRISGWTVIPDNIHYVGTYWNASDGNRSLDLDGATGFAGGIQQTFPTTPGTQYLVSFDLAGNPEAGPTIKNMRVSADGQSAVFTFDITGKSNQNMGWITKTWSFTADNSLATLQFVSLTGSGWGPVLDNVRVQASEIQACVPSSSGIIGWWPLDETAGLIASDIIGGNNGTHLGGPLPGSGQVDGALNFDGIDDRVLVNSTFPLHQPGDATLEFWLNTPATGHQSVFWTRTDDADLDRFNIFVNGDGTFGFDYRSPSGDLHILVGRCCTGVPIPRDTWTHIAITRTGNVYDLYINGVFSASATDTSPDLPTTSGWQMSGRGGGMYKGALDEVGVYNHALSASEVAAIYLAGGAGKCKTSHLQFYPLLRPVRLLDTRAGQGNCDNVSAPIAAGTTLATLARATCEGITIPANAKAVVGNLTAINRDMQNAGYLTIYPDGQSVPLASNMIYTPGQIIANNFTVALSNDGKFNVFGERTIDVVIDISGYYAPPGAGGLYYHPLPSPIRLLDTRSGQGNCDHVNTPIAEGTSITVQARTTCEGLTIPATAQALVANATVVNVSGQLGYMTIYPEGVPVPLASNLIYYPGQILSNAFTVSLSANGEFDIFAERTIDAIVDVAGYYSSEAVDANGPGLLFTALERPVRILDTRANQGNCDSVSAPITGGTSIAAPGHLTCEGITIPTTAQSLLGNVTAINRTSQAGFLTLYPDGVAQPVISNMVYFPGQLLANAFVVGVNGNNGQYRIFAERTLDAVVDVSGYFAP